MLTNKQVDLIKKKFNKSVYLNYNLSKSSWLNTGGLAKIFFKPHNTNELSEFLKFLKENAKIIVIGAGSNILIRDGGFNGIVIKLGKKFSHISLLNENTIVAGAAASDKDVSSFALKNKIKNFEFLSCIPGSIGGAIRMNCGCYGEELFNLAISVQAIDKKGNLIVIPVSKIKYFYRGSDLDDDLIFLSVTLKGEKADEKDILKKINELLQKKGSSQPSKIKTCGSTFKNPTKGSSKQAWELIKNSNCQHLAFGDAHISKKHSNFLINKKSATSQDIEKLINAIKKQVFNKTGVKLELELKIIGEPK